MTELRRPERLDSKRHKVVEFECGQPTLDQWLRAYASQSQRRDVARTFVAADEDLRVAGYYTLVAGQAEHADVPDSVSRGVSRRFPIPVCLIARLAVDRRWQNQGVGSGLLRDGLRRTLAAAELIGIRAVLVDAIDESAVDFYRQYGFEPTGSEGQSLMVPLAAVRARLA